MTSVTSGHNLDALFEGLKITFGRATEDAKGEAVVPPGWSVDYTDSDPWLGRSDTTLAWDLNEGEAHRGDGPFGPIYWFNHEQYALIDDEGIAPVLMALEIGVPGVGEALIDYIRNAAKAQGDTL